MHAALQGRVKCFASRQLILALQLWQPDAVVYHLVIATLLALNIWLVAITTDLRWKDLPRPAAGRGAWPSQYQYSPNPWSQPHGLRKRQ